MPTYWDPIKIEAEKKTEKRVKPHQQQAIEAMDAYFNIKKRTKNNNGLLVMPTGSGKTFTAVNWLVNSCIAQGYRVIWLVHRQELVDQTYHAFTEQIHDLSDIGTEKIKILPVSGQHLSMAHVTKGDINICSIQSVANKNGSRFIRRMVGMQGLRKLVVVIDEAHHAVSPSYTKVLKKITQLNSKRILLGLTATPARMQERDLKRLLTMFNVYENIESKTGTKRGFIYEITLKELIISGFLSKPVYIKVSTNINGDTEYQLSEDDQKFFNQFGELSEGMKSKIASSAARNRFILDTYLNNYKKFGKTILFALNQDHARKLQAAFEESGISCHYAISDDPNSQDTIRAFKNGEFDVLVNVQILTEGSDIPDVQTVFLTRQTNSDSLLMQMIGRGLRGPAAGGTKEAYIVDFHDTWEKFSFWVDPSHLSIFESEEEDDSWVPVLTVARQEKESPFDDEEILSMPVPVDEGEIYSKIYRNMKSNLETGFPLTVFPAGWYAITDDEGNDHRVLVYESQLSGYKAIETNITKIVQDEWDINAVFINCFERQQEQPLFDDLANLIESIRNEEEMPEFFTFEQRDLVDARSIATEMNKRFTEETDKIAWLTAIFSTSPILQDLYKEYYVFSKAVYDAESTPIEKEYEYLDEREEYEIIENYHDLDALLDEVMDAYPFINKENFHGIRWTNRCMKSYFGRCRKWIDDSGKTLYVIDINRLLSSPQVDKEVIKYLIYHEMLHKMGFWNHNEEFRNNEWAYPNSDEYDGALDEIHFKYDVESYYKKSKASRKMEENSAVIKETEIKFCRECGNKLPIEAKFCDKCGTNLTY